MQFEQALASGYITGSVTIGTSIVKLFPDLGHSASQGIQLIAQRGNAGSIHIGGRTVTAGTDSTKDGYPLVAQDSIFLRVKDLGSIYAVADMAGQKLFFLYL